MKARELMLFALLANVGSAYAYMPPATFGPEAIQQPAGGDAGDQGDQKKDQKKKGKKKGEGKKDDGSKDDSSK